MVKVKVFVLKQPCVLVARTTKLADEEAVGVPLMTPELESDRPASNEPLSTLHVQVCAGTLVPAMVAVSVCE